MQDFDTIVSSARQLADAAHQRQNSINTLFALAAQFAPDATTQANIIAIDTAIQQGMIAMANALAAQTAAIVVVPATAPVNPVPVVVASIS